MITYTKRNINFISAIITILIFLIFSTMHFSNGFQILNNKLYKKQISLGEIYEKQNQERIGSNAQASLNNETSDILEIDSNQENNEIDENLSTQRDWVNKYKNVNWRIEIPKINLDVHIQEGTSLDVMLYSVGHFEETSKWNGNVGLAAHNRGNKCNFFQDIKKLKIGDEIIYKTTNGKKVYKVQTNKVILETDWSYLEETNDNRITLITCEENRKEYRRCIQAVEVMSIENTNEI